MAQSSALAVDSHGSGVVGGSGVTDAQAQERPIVFASTQTLSRRFAALHGTRPSSGCASSSLLTGAGKSIVVGRFDAVV